MRRRPGGDAGSVVAEFAVALPAIALVLVLAMAALDASGRQVRLQDAAADAARLAGRGEAAERVHGVIAAAVPGAVSEIEQRGDLVCVSASVSATLPLTLTATSCALAGGL